MRSRSRRRRRIGFTGGEVDDEPRFRVSTKCFSASTATGQCGDERERRRRCAVMERRRRRRVRDSVRRRRVAPAG